jgi:hypothetical protein
MPGSSFIPQRRHFAGAFDRTSGSIGQTNSIGFASS